MPRPPADPSPIELVEDFGILITDALADLDDQRGVDEVIVDFLRSPANTRFVGAVLADTGWRPPTGPCTRTTLKRPHGPSCSLTESGRSWYGGPR